MRKEKPSLFSTTRESTRHNASETKKESKKEISLQSDHAKYNNADYNHRFPLQSPNSQPYPKHTSRRYHKHAIPPCRNHVQTTSLLGHKESDPSTGTRSNAATSFSSATEPSVSATKAGTRSLVPLSDTHWPHI
jgi:hypothetical protein